MYILLCGYPPFNGDNDDQILRSVYVGKFNFAGGKSSSHLDEWKTVSPESKDLITKMLAHDPAKRISAEECLSHPWIKHSGSESISTSMAKNVLTNLKSFRVVTDLSLGGGKTEASNHYLHCDAAHHERG